MLCCYHRITNHQKVFFRSCQRWDLWILKRNGDFNRNFGFNQSGFNQQKFGPVASRNRFLSRNKSGLNLENLVVKMSSIFFSPKHGLCFTPEE